MPRDEKTNLSPLTPLLGCIALVLLFLVVAVAVSQDITTRIDRAVLLAFRRPGDPALPLGPAWFTDMVRNVTALGSYPLLVFFTLASAVYLYLDRKRNAALFLLAAVGGGIALSQGLKLFFARPRPDVVPALVETFTSSFPSTHAVLSAVVYLTLGALLARIEATTPAIRRYFLGVAIGLTITIGLTRLYLGVHYPTDVLAGWCIGAAWAIGAWTLALHLQRRRRI